MTAASYTIEPPAGDPVVSARVTDFGATLTHLVVRDRNGVERDVVLGFDSPEQYVASKKNEGYAYYGSTVGRVANRISNASFEIDGTRYQTSDDLLGCTLHGGRDAGWDSKIWLVYSSSVRQWLIAVFCNRTVQAQASDSITFSIMSPDGDGGFPGTLQASVTYSITPTELVLAYSARLLPDSPQDATIVSLTNHSYFNLSGMLEPNVDEHVLWFSKDVTGWLKRGPSNAPTGEVLPISADPEFDFRVPAALASRHGANFDDFFVLNNGRGAKGSVAVAHCPSTGLEMGMQTTEPGFQLYVPQGPTSFISKETQGKKPYLERAAFCLEASRYPDAVNKEGWREQVLLRKGQEYGQRTIYSFRIRDA